MTRDDVRKAAERMKEMIKSNQSSLETIREIYKQAVSDIDRMKRGDNLREILIDSAMLRLKSITDNIAQQEDQIRIQQAQLRALADALEG